MHRASQSIVDFKLGLRKALPIMLGYIPIAISFGIIASQFNLTSFQSVFMSMVVYAGASQFMAVNMLFIGASLIEIVIATFILNFRHFVMSMSFMNKLEKVPTIWKVFLSYGVTDETFAVALFERKETENASRYFFAGLFIGVYLSWAFGTLLGSILASIIPRQLSESMSIAIYAMFIALLVPAIKRSWKIALIACLSGILNYTFSFWASRGWGIVLSTILGAFLGVFLLGDDD